MGRSRGPPRGRRDPRDLGRPPHGRHPGRSGGVVGDQPLPRVEPALAAAEHHLREGQLPRPADPVEHDRFPQRLPDGERSLARQHEQLRDPLRDRPGQLDLDRHHGARQLAAQCLPRRERQLRLPRPARRAQRHRDHVAARPLRGSADGSGPDLRQRHERRGRVCPERGLGPGLLLRGQLHASSPTTGRRSPAASRPSPPTPSPRTSRRLLSSSSRSTSTPSPSRRSSASSTRPTEP